MLLFRKLHKFVYLEISMNPSRNKLTGVYHPGMSCRHHEEINAHQKCDMMAWIVQTKMAQFQHLRERSVEASEQQQQVIVTLAASLELIRASLVG